MLIPDLNLLIYAYSSNSARHQAARDWWEELLRGKRPVGLPWAVILGYVRIMTNPRIHQDALTPEQAIQDAREWLAQPVVQVVTPGERHAEILFGLLEQLGTAGNLTTDAHLAALAIEYRAELATTDADFSRFPKLRWVNPIAGSGTRR